MQEANNNLAAKYHDSIRLIDKYESMYLNILSYVSMAKNNKTCSKKDIFDNLLYIERVLRNGLSKTKGYEKQK